METMTINDTFLGYPKPKPQPTTAKEWYNQEMTCCKCGLKSNDRHVVSTFYTYVAGNYVWREECVSLRDCQHRLGW